VLSARVIVGNEKAVYRMQNDFVRMGVNVRNQKTDPDLHVSGHAAKSEQLHMLELIRPEAFVAVHGTLHHLRAHAELAGDAGVVETAVVENGQPVVVRPSGPLEFGAKVPAGRTLIATGGFPLSVQTRRRRIELGRRGVVLVSVALDARGQLTGEPVVVARGIPGVDDNPRAMALLGADARAAARLAKGDRVEEAIRRAVRRTLGELSGGRPLVEVGVVTIP